MATDRLLPYARLPHAYRNRDVLHSTVDAFGRAHWLVRDAPPLREPYDALVVTVEDGHPHETRLSSVRSRLPLLGALPDGGFVVADIRSRPGEEQVQVFDASGRPSGAFTVGDAVEHLLTDESGDLWVGHFDEGTFDDPLSEPGVRRWSSTGAPLWEYGRPSGTDRIVECYALNVDRRATWVYPYPDFPLVEVRSGRPAFVRGTPVRGAHGVVVHGSSVAFFGGYDDQHDRLVLGALTDISVDPVAESRLLRPDGIALGSRYDRRVVSRGSRLYVQEKPYTEWMVFALD
jgi:hypothetical protein